MAGNAFAEERICSEGKICVFPGDFLIYSGNQVEEFSYFFEESYGDDKIQFVHKSSNNGDAFEQRYVLDLQNGDTFKIESPDDKDSSFVMISSIPVQIDQFSSDVTEGTYQFKEMERPVWIVSPEVEGGSSKIILDKETGIVLEMNIKVESEIEGQPLDFELVNKLLDTNIINPSTQVKLEKQIQETVPDWIRNTALWWSEDKISDDEFVNGIQFLINNGIIQVSVESKMDSQTPSFVPNWIKETAGWWATNQVSDQDFLNGLKWLIENGILRV